MVGLLLLTGACSDDDGGAAGTTLPGSTTSSAPSTSTSAPATTTTTPPTSTSVPATTTTGPPTSAPATTTPVGCTAADGAVPTGPDVATGQVPDVDGDGRADTAWMAVSDAAREMGIATAAGGVVRTRVDSASPVALSLLVADADGRAPVELFVDDNRTVQLWAFSDCQLVPVLNPQGQPYEFDRGFRGTGTGVGCVNTAEGRRLVGLNVDDPRPGDPPTLVRWTRTIIELDGTSARNGASTSGTFSHPGDDAAIDLLHQVTCGDRTMAADGIRQPER